MKKTIFLLLCLAIVSVGIASVAASDNGTMTGDFIQTIDQQDACIDAHVAYESNLENTAVPADNNDINNIDDSTTNVDDATNNEIDDSTINVDNATDNEIGNTTINVDNVQDIGMKPVAKSSQLNIPGPKNGNPVKLPDPKGNNGPKKPHIDFTPMEKDIFKYAEIFAKNNGWTMYGMLKYVAGDANKDYTWAQIALIVTRAHNIAFDKNHNSHYYMQHRYLSFNEVANELQQYVYFFTKTTGAREF